MTTVIDVIELLDMCNTSLKFGQTDSGNWYFYINLTVLTVHGDNEPIGVGVTFEDAEIDCLEQIEGKRFKCGSRTYDAIDIIDPIDLDMTVEYLTERNHEMKLLTEWAGEKIQ